MEIHTQQVPCPILDKNQPTCPNKLAKHNREMNQKHLEEMARANTIQMQLINMNILRRDISTCVDGFECDFYIHAKKKILMELEETCNRLMNNEGGEGSQEAANDDDNESSLPDINFNRQSSNRSEPDPDSQYAPSEDNSEGNDPSDSEGFDQQPPNSANLESLIHPNLL